MQTSRRSKGVGGPRSRGVWAAVLAARAVTLSGCAGYTTQEVYPEQYQSVAVPVLENRTARVGAERAVTEALIKEIEQRTPYRVTSPGTAQTLLTGTLVGLEDDLLSRTRVGGVPQELETTVTIDFVWRDLRTGEVLVSRSGFSAVGRYSPTRQLGERPEIGLSAAVQQLARDVVSSLRKDW
ncbi:MAG: LPS assembly lipoprotein LptE [Planctomycetota bacterium]